MSRAEELLNSLSDDELEKRIAESQTEEHIVISHDRTIAVPMALRKIAVQFDNNVETVTFDCPRYWDDVDISGMDIYINYMRPDNKPGCYIVDNVRVDEIDKKQIHFEWTITRNVSEIKGTLSFLVCAKSINDRGEETYHWNSELNKEMIVSEGLECGNPIVEKYPDVIEQILAKLEAGFSEQEIQKAINAYLVNHPIDEKDPTVPQWAKQPNKPSYTASEVGSDQSGTAERKVSEHDISTAAHNDIRSLINELTSRLNTLADSDDATLDQLSEIVSYIKNNKNLIEGVTTNKINTSDIINDLTTDISTKVLSAAQGVKIKRLIDSITIPETLPNPNSLTFTGAVNETYDGSQPKTVKIPIGITSDTIEYVEKIIEYVPKEGESGSKIYFTKEEFPGIDKIKNGFYIVANYKDNTTETPTWCKVLVHTNEGEYTIGDISVGRMLASYSICTKIKNNMWSNDYGAVNNNEIPFDKIRLDFMSFKPVTRCERPGDEDKSLMNVIVHGKINKISLSSFDNYIGRVYKIYVYAF